MEPAEDTFILSVPGTDQTRELSREALMRELVTGKITSEHWVWSAADADWKQISQLPALLMPSLQTPPPIEKLVVNAAPLAQEKTPGPISRVTVNPAPIPKDTPAPISKVTVNPSPLGRDASAIPGAVSKITVNPAPISKEPDSFAATTKSPFVPTPKTTAAAEPPPKVTPPPVLAPIKKQPSAKQTAYKAAAAPARKTQVVRTRSAKIEDHEHDDGLPYMKMLFAFLYLAVAAIVAANYLLIDKGFDDALAHTPFVLIPAHAHLGSFVQPNALVIHILPNTELTSDNLADYLQTLAKNTPDQPLRGGPFATVALTSAWFGQYVLRGEDWRALGKMSEAKTEDRKDFIADHLFTLTGQPLIHNESMMAPAQVTDARDHAWKDLTSHLISHG